MIDRKKLKCCKIVNFRKIKMYLLPKYAYLCYHEMKGKGERICIYG